jgi:hypothetical protein
MLSFLYGVFPMYWCVKNALCNCRTYLCLFAGGAQQQLPQAEGMGAEAGGGTMSAARYALSLS